MSYENISAELSEEEFNPSRLPSILPPRTSSHCTCWEINPRPLWKQHLDMPENGKTCFPVTWN